MSNRNHLPPAASRSRPATITQRPANRSEPRVSGDQPASACAPDAITIHTRDGQPLVVRCAQPADADQISAMLQRLSDRSRLLRYLLPRSFDAAEAQREAQRITRGRDCARLALLAIVASTGAVIAVAELARDAQHPTTGEFALVVQDDRQGVGIGTALLHQIVRNALALGITRLHADVLPENQAMRALIRHTGLAHRTTYQHGALQIEVRIK
jgi:RimJ/RimL family protein N-acetyltransferase